MSEDEDYDVTQGVYLYTKYSGMNELIVMYKMTDEPVIQALLEKLMKKEAEIVQQQQSIELVALKRNSIRSVK